MYRLAGALLGVAAPLPALAQEAARLDASALSDYRERGLSWSDGKPAALVNVDLPVAAGLVVSAQAATTRGSARHGSADAALTLRATYGQEAGLLRWHGGLARRVFAGGTTPLDYLEGELELGFMIGPLDLAVLGSYAPPQRALGGNNAYLRARARFALPGTPLTLDAHVGHSSGDIDDRERALRLRPGGNYADWGLGADYALGPATLSLTYTDTDIRRRNIAVPAAPHVPPRHYGARIVAGMHFGF